MTLALHPDWKKIASRAWSMRFAYVSAAYSGVEAALSLAIEGRLTTMLVVFVISAAIAFSRIVHQETVSGALPQAAAE